MLGDGVAYRAGDIDVVWTSGYGFPRHKGGPMFYGDSLGLAHVLERMKHFHKLYGHYWKPAPLLERLVKEGRTFDSWDKSKNQ